MNIFSLISMLGGLTFFLFGMSVMSGSLEKMAGGRLEHLLQKMTSSHGRGILLGAAITVAVQSSSATTVMLVGFVNSGIMKLGQTVDVIFGANIGTTLTSWIFGLSGIESSNFLVQMIKPANFAPILAFIGILLRMMSKNDTKKSVGTIFVGFAVLISGMTMMTDAVAPLADSPAFSQILLKFHNPILGLLLGTIITAVIQSSAASVGILQALASTGSVSIAFSVPIIMGQNIGTCVTSLLSSIGTNTKAKRVAMIHLFINVIGTAVWLIVFCLVDLFFAPALFAMPADGFSIAIIHTIFNLATAIILLPFEKLLILIAEKLVPEKQVNHVETPADNILLDERLLLSPSAALAACDAAAKEMIELAHGNLTLAMDLLHATQDSEIGYSESDEQIIESTEDEIDMFEDKLGTYLVKLSSQALSDKDGNTVTKILHVIGDFERLGDHAINLRKAAKELSEKKEMQFTEEATTELHTLEAAVDEILDITVKCYTEDDVHLASQVEPLEQVIDYLTAQIRKNHINRLQHGTCSIETGFVLSDILTNYKRISDHCSNIAVAVIEAKHGSFDTHQYLNDVKYGGSDTDFDSCRKKYEQKYSI